MAAQGRALRSSPADGIGSCRREWWWFIALTEGRAFLQRRGECIDLKERAWAYLGAFITYFSFEVAFNACVL